MFHAGCSTPDVPRRMFHGGCSTPRCSTPRCSTPDVPRRMFRAGCSTPDVPRRCSTPRCSTPDVPRRMFHARMFHAGCSTPGCSTQDVPRRMFHGGRSNATPSSETPASTPAASQGDENDRRTGRRPRQSAQDDCPGPSAYPRKTNQRADPTGSSASLFKLSAILLRFSSKRRSSVSVLSSSEAAAVWPSKPAQVRAQP